MTTLCQETLSNVPFQRLAVSGKRLCRPRRNEFPGHLNNRSLGGAIRTDDLIHKIESASGMLSNLDTHHPWDDLSSASMPS